VVGTHESLRYHAPMAGQRGPRGGGRGRAGAGARPRARAGDGPLRVGVLGAGTVGREVVITLLSGWASDYTLAGVAVRDIPKAQASGLATELLTDAPAHLVAEGPDVLIELMGGEEPARTLIGAALGAGIPVVTANKYVVARHGAELEAIARRTGAPFRFEGAVMGGTPILRLLAEDLWATDVREVRGIINGTTNHILTEMATRGLTYEAALAGAQAAGYAEADPTGDVEGGDAGDKLVILSRLAFGEWPDRASVVVSRDGGRPGITGVTAQALEAATKRGQAIRLVAAARRGGDGAIELSVLPTEVASDSPLGRTNGVRNRIEIESDRLGWIGIEGPGAGGAATAAAVLADLAAIAVGGGSTWGALPPATTAGRLPGPAPDQSSVDAAASAAR
jgi:homoserine dehydrogenase